MLPYFAFDIMWSQSDQGVEQQYWGSADESARPTHQSQLSIMMFHPIFITSNNQLTCTSTFKFGPCLLHVLQSAIWANEMISLHFKELSCRPTSCTVSWYTTSFMSLYHCNTVSFCWSKMQHLTDRRSFAVKLSRESHGPQSTVQARTALLAFLSTKGRWHRYIILFQNLWINWLKYRQSINLFVAILFVDRKLYVYENQEDILPCRMEKHPVCFNPYLVKAAQSFDQIVCQRCDGTALFIPFVQLQRASVIPEPEVNLPIRNLMGLTRYCNWNGKTVLLGRPVAHLGMLPIDAIKHNSMDGTRMLQINK